MRSSCDWTPQRRRAGPEVLQNRVCRLTTLPAETGQVVVVTGGRYATTHANLEICAKVAVTGCR
ncbi:hypothetical protein [Micromonospora halophytica]|uniref:Uncharacterized protein n=1 Tax=Micromonospora halophytica TaxID=47864 RepID=A0A1C5JA72_9ACTN|nr:hypothetical protein [Micromonospora halophytica]SCG67504.1 hypothetical protein GA0070560_12561 [Micromonospora halophytica]